ncbi:MAG: 16S rRNA (cytosine(1402)-N(4))-methyltransferase RsmH [Ardenticatenaceae bacterium]|nr:16S rRNA (cytosine(1402)-N(4))-methyltransferase RsmH [Anaerolineales bacterium]MCB8922322.1 16S rRNA (cytosine(1402)-N(4))-methyltransferase RsmH [Ardenticatenaceae bacterium]MCB8990494.1 16S rRNA (cytosine(1402)-N(4))-methyltransferase RsmH [Ardenticatenaceae bacterium]
MAHIPVLYQEVLDLLRPLPNGRYIDGTVGAGGHTAGLLEKSAPTGRVLAFDRDPEAVLFAQEKLASFGKRVTFVNASYAEMGTLAPAHGFEQVDGILLDLGLSSRQLDDSERGFSFMREGPLDMRFDSTQGETAADLVNNLAEADLADIFWRYGEEKQSRKIARVVVQKRPFHTTTQLADTIAQAIRQRGRIHPATLVFQALRIAVNGELDAVENGVQTAVTLLKSGGRLAVISFHSLEDRFVKQYFRQLAQDCVCPPTQPVCTCDAHATVRLVTRKAVKATAVEIADNPRSRSARLRVIEKLEISMGQ